MLLRRAAVSAALVAAPLAFAAPALADGTTVDCSPCARGSTVQADETPTPIWDQIFANAPWEKVFDPNGDGQGAWEKGVQAVNGGAWEKVFPPADDG